MKRITYLVISICWLVGIAYSQEKDSLATSGYISIPLNSSVITSYQSYGKWDWKTISFPKSSDTMRIIIDKDTIFTDENYFRVMIRYELKKMTTPFPH